MKKILRLTLLAGLCSFSYNGLKAQEWQTHFGVKAGVNMINYQLSNVSSGISRQTSSSVGFMLAGTFDASPSKYFGLQTGLQFQLLGANLKYSEFGSSSVLQHTGWAQIPINLVGKLPLGELNYFFLSGGVYGGLGLFGKNWVPNSYEGNVSHSFSFGNEGTQKRVDYGWDLSVGYQTPKNISLSVSYLKGLADLAPDNARYEQRNKVWQFAVGYRF
ncbi:Outer membrane protein beta-barrel domain-containing protein [bacterium A37T11]|nr:Outer membrane protein beta-barrel domain-containing protein [bacterium A37T11]